MNSEIKNTICGIYQRKLLELGLDIKDAYILTLLKDMIGTTGDIQKIVDGVVYYSIDYNDICEFLPIIEINNTKVISRRITKYENLGLLSKHTHKKYDNEKKAFDGAYTFITLKESFRDLFEVSSINIDTKKIAERAKKMGLEITKAEGTQKFSLVEEKIAEGTFEYPLGKPLETLGFCREHSGVPSREGTQKCLHSSSSNYIFNNKKKDINTKKTTTNNIRNNVKENININYVFLNNKNFYPELVDSTIFNINKNIIDLTEDKFNVVYRAAKTEIKRGFGKNINAVIYRALTKRWEFQATNKNKLTTSSESLAEIERILERNYEYAIGYVECNYNETNVIEVFNTLMKKEYPKDLVERYLLRIRVFFENRGV